MVDIASRENRLNPAQGLFMEHGESLAKGGRCEHPTEVEREAWLHRMRTWQFQRRHGVVVVNIVRGHNATPRISRNSRLILRYG
ncbi:hypothetical protein [Nitrobacter winogradskyi]|uniref:Uncharacterized protein n=1 Tax=Nitrobacter winogradskyi TaxID=913 RepID=A0ACC6AHH2_NITWI|nr:hypothetical protein [Nitrobacter winogradskyi]MCP1998967.1 hypothetical protein [Nitrobacter winogradskyi]